MSGPVIPSRDAWNAISEMYRWWRSYRTQGAQGGQVGQADRRQQRSHIRLAVATEDISANTYGKFRFAYGIKGAEEMDEDEDEYDGFYRCSDDDDRDIPEGALCTVEVWPTTSSNSAWEIRWIGKPAVHLVRADADIDAGDSGLFEFIGTDGTPTGQIVSMLSPNDISEDAFAHASLVNGVSWYAYPVDCE